MRFDILQRLLRTFQGTFFTGPYLYGVLLKFTMKSNVVFMQKLLNMVKKLFWTIVNLKTRELKTQDRDPIPKAGPWHWRSQRWAWGHVARVSTKKGEGEKEGKGEKERKREERRKSLDDLSKNCIGLKY